MVEFIKLTIGLSMEYCSGGPYELGSVRHCFLSCHSIGLLECYWH